MEYSRVVSSTIVSFSAWCMVLVMVTLIVAQDGYPLQSEGRPRTPGDEDIGGVDEGVIIGYNFFCA